jgi:hypothetical protein
MVIKLRAPTPDDGSSSKEYVTITITSWDNRCKVQELASIV